MTRIRSILSALLCLLTLLPGCAWLGREPVRVAVVGVEPMAGEGMEMRLLVKLRVQNPNETPIDYDGIFVEMRMAGRELATGVSDASGSVPRYGEMLVSVPVTISALNLARQALGIAASGGVEKLRYELTGKLSGPRLRAAHFSTQGELALPAPLRVNPR